MTTPSVWQTSNALPVGNPLTDSLSTDVCIIGGGIAGLTTAYRLLQAGRSVVLLEANTLGGGESARTTAHLAWVVDNGFSRLAKIRGDNTAKQAAASHRSAIDDIEQLIKTEGIDCDFHRIDGYVLAGNSASKALEVERTTAQRLGLACETISSLPVLGGPALLFPDQARFHPGYYLRGLAVAVQKLGGTIATKTRATRIIGENSWTIHTAAGPSVSATSVVISTNTPFDAGETLHARLAAYTTYALAIQVPQASIPDALYWDMEDPYHYIRLRPAGRNQPDDLLIVGGEDHKTGQAHNQHNCWTRLAEWAKSQFPMMGSVEYRWSGQVFETADGLGLIGAVPGKNNMYVITGDSGMGLTHGTLGGRLVTDLMTQGRSEYAAIYDPARWTPRAFTTLLRENTNLAAQYADWVTGSDVPTIDQIPRGHGAVIRRGFTKVAVVRKEDGSICEKSAVCPHLKAIVRWNPCEQTWDCPAHGSRFEATGRVLHGPAVTDLADL